MNKTIYLYLATSLVAFLFSGTYIYLEECYYNDSFIEKTEIEKQLYVKYCTNPLSFNPFDNYYSKLENYVIIICFIIGSWNMMDGLIALEILKDANINQNDKIKRKDLYKRLIVKLTKCKFCTKIIYSRKNKVSNIKK